MNITDFNQTTGNCENTSCKCENRESCENTTPDNSWMDHIDEPRVSLNESVDEDIPGVSDTDSIPPLVEADDNENCDECGGECDGVHSLKIDTNKEFTITMEEIMEHFNEVIIKKPVFVIKINDEIKGYVSSEEEAQRTIDLQYEKILLTQIQSSYRMYTEKTVGKTTIYGNYRFMGIISYNQILYTLSYERVNRL
jgi:hypothetical protein